MASWQIPLEFVEFNQLLQGFADIDALSGATLLDGYKNSLETSIHQDKTK